MAITKFKLIRTQSRDINADSESARLDYKAWYGTAAEAEAYALANSVQLFVSAASGRTLFRNSVGCNSEAVDERVWGVSIEYTTAPKKERSEIGDESVSWDISTQSVNTKISPQTVNRYAASGETAPDFKGGVGYDGEKFEGMDVLFPVMSFTVTKIVAIESVTNAYIQSLCNNAVRWNVVPYKGFPAGEVLYVGSAGSQRDEKSYANAFKFMQSPNFTNLTRGDITGIAKQGWDYLWPLFRETEDTTAKFITPRPIAAYVERPYLSFNLASVLGLNA